jgi:phosphoribosylformylglycinamidine synthase
MLGAVIQLDALSQTGVRLDEILFGEAPSRILLTVHPEDLSELEKISAKHGVPCSKLGTTGGYHLTFQNAGREILRLPVRQLSDVWRASIPKKTGLAVS